MVEHIFTHNTWLILLTCEIENSVVFKVDGVVQDARVHSQRQL